MTPVGVVAVVCTLTACERPKGGVADDGPKAAFGEFLRALIAGGHSEQWDFTVWLDPRCALQAWPGAPSGQAPVRLSVLEDGSVEWPSVLPPLPAGPSLNERLQHKALGGSTLSLLDTLVGLAGLGTLAAFLLKQLFREVGRRIDDVIASSTVERRAVGPFQVVPHQHSDNNLHGDLRLESKLCLYIRFCQSACGGKSLMHMSLSADTGRVGSLGVLNVVAALPSGVGMVLPPQALCARFSVHCVSELGSWRLAHWGPSPEFFCKSHT